MAASLRPIPYLADSSCYFAAIRELSQAVWLDSGSAFGQFGRFDILSAAPRVLLTTRGAQTQIQRGEHSHFSQDNPLGLLEKELALQDFGEPHVDDLPFSGGAIGYFGYHLHEHLSSVSSSVPRDINMPDMAVGIYDWAIVQDHESNSSWLVTQASCSPSMRATLQERLLRAVEQTPQPGRGFAVGRLSSNFDQVSYTACIDRIHDYIRAGDCYQVNFAQRFSGEFKGDPFSAYRHLRQLLPAPYGAYLELAGGAILSHSPEQFLRLRGYHVETRPIKGTAPRRTSPDEDRAAAQQLQASPKDRAENLMIVDLLRNDIGKVCRFGSVEVPTLFALESYANVHHLVSTVSGRLAEDRSGLDLLAACFPGGSITGAPKRRAMEIIAELERCDRSVYCGSIGYVNANGDMDTNIAIRSLVCHEGRVHCWGGGGIVADSSSAEEYAESLAKITVLLEGLATVPGNGP